MKLLIILTTLITLAVLSKTANVSYTNLSLKYTYNAFTNIDTSILNQDSNPGDLGKLRKQLLLTRTYLDIFIYAYPINGTGKYQDVDCSEVLRKNLNKGYTAIGNFDDLQHVNYTKSDRSKLLNKCLNWKSDFNKDIDNYNFKEYLNNVSEVIYLRPKKELSVDFWGNISFIPTRVLGGYQNIGMLASGQLNISLIDYDYTVGLENIWETKYHNIFHDYRKLIRSINFLANKFSEIYSVDVSKYIQHLEKAYTSLGKINDLINEYVYYNKNGDSGKAARKQQEIVDKWKDLRDWFNQINLRGLLEKLISLVI